MNEKVIVGIIFLCLLVLDLCLVCWLWGYKKGTNDQVKFFRDVWKTAEREAGKEMRKILGELHGKEDS